MLHADLVDVADWEAKAAKTLPQGSVVHFHAQTPEWTCRTGLGIKGKLHCDGKEAAIDSLLCSAAGLFRKYAHDALIQSFPAAADPLWPHMAKGQWLKMTEQFITAHHWEALRESNSVELRWMVALIGDLHQPLHWLQQHNYGKEIIVVYQGQKYSLYDFWEDVIPKKLPPMPSDQDLEAAYAKDVDGWKLHVPTELMRDWAREEAELACRGIIQGMEVNHGDGRRGIDKEFRVTEEVLAAWVQLAQDATTRAGVRLAFVLLDLVEHRKHILATLEGRGHRHRHIQHQANLGFNFGIAVLVVPILLLMLQWHERAGGPSMLRSMAKQFKA